MVALKRVRIHDESQKTTSYVVDDRNCPRLERRRDSSRRSPNEGKNNKATKSTELHKTRQFNMVLNIIVGVVPSLLFVIASRRSNSSLQVNGRGLCDAD